MPRPSDTSVLMFLGLVAIVAILLVVGLARRAPGEDRAVSRRWFAVSLVILAIWTIPSALAAARGALTFTGRPPTFFLLLLLTTLATAVLAFSPAGTRLVTRVGIAGLIGFQAFRLPLELLLHRLHGEGALPVQMTFAGSNFDIVSGVLGAVVGIWALAGRVPRWAVLAFNLIGLALLVTIVTIAILSMPTPLRRFHDGTAPTIVASWPFVWLPAFLVQAAWFGHLLVFRKLAAR
ncbi:MAG TPA: hypothetical protein VFP58_07970 [Candidatus Eisenbacteria bacterium]|nr:hypothetical protein [Candidatus Eisenbacteria bacterium]